MWLLVLSRRTQYLTLEQLLFLVHGHRGALVLGDLQHLQVSLASFHLDAFSCRNACLGSLPIFFIWSQDLGSVQPSAARSPSSHLLWEAYWHLGHPVTVQQYTGPVHSHTDAVQPFWPALISACTPQPHIFKKKKSRPFQSADFCSFIYLFTKLPPKQTSSFALKSCFTFFYLLIGGLEGVEKQQTEQWPRESMTSRESPSTAM